MYYNILESTIIYYNILSYTNILQHCPTATLWLDTLMRPILNFTTLDSLMLRNLKIFGLLMEIMRSHWQYNPIRSLLIYPNILVMKPLNPNRKSLNPKYVPITYLWLARNEGTDPYSSPEITRHRSFHFLFQSFIPS